MKPKLAVGVSYFNSVKELPRLLNPIYKHVDLIIGIDGRYPLFDWKSNVSTDGSTELLLQKYNAVVEVNRDPVEQIDKRNQYLEIADKAGMDFLLVLDTDDYLSRKSQYQNWELFYQELADLPQEDNLANIYFWMSPKWVKNWNVVKDNSWVPYTRVIRPNKIRYRLSHWTYVLKDNPDWFEAANYTMKGLRFTANSVYRSKEYVQAGYKWAKKQMDEENKRFADPEFRRMKFSYQVRMIQKALKTAIPGTVIDTTEEQITKLNP